MPKDYVGIKMLRESLWKKSVQNDVKKCDPLVKWCYYLTLEFPEISSKGYFFACAIMNKSGIKVAASSNRTVSLSIPFNLRIGIWETRFRNENS